MCHKWLFRSCDNLISSIDRLHCYLGQINSEGNWLVEAYRQEARESVSALVQSGPRRKQKQRALLRPQSIVEYMTFNIESRYDSQSKM